MNNTIKYNRGLADGKASKDMANPIHKNWKGGKHFCQDYEKGYWAGYKSK